MTTIRVIFDGKTFIPQQPVSLPSQSEGLVIAENGDPAAQQQLDAAIRAYYQGVQGNGDTEDDACGKATTPHRIVPGKRNHGFHGEHG